MNSLRPLVTITILIVVGAFLYVKINQGPKPPVPAANDLLSPQAADVPPLSIASSPSATDAAAPPAWPASDTPAVLTAERTESMPSPAAGATAPQAPAVPAIPAMPELAPTAQVSNATTPVTTPALATQLPANIPTAQYPDQPGAPAAATPNVAANSSPPTTNPTTASVDPSITPIEPPPATPEQANATTQQSTNFESPPLAAQANTLRDTLAPGSEVDRYATAAPVSPVSAAPAATAQLSFATSWPEIDATLRRGELAKAHQLLSRWYEDPSLTPTDKELVDNLLSQLAGTVVYSTEHQLEPPYVVKSGETLEAIAKEYNVPWQLLAKINGIAAADQVQPGQQLKVLRGPFSAIVDLSLKQLTLMLDGRYAGKFPVAITPGVEYPAGEWVVLEKIPGAPQQPSAYPAAQPQTQRSLVLKNADTATVNPGMPLVIGSAPTLQRELQVGAVASAEQSSAALIQVSPADAEEVADILSIGSKVVVRR